MKTKKFLSLLLALAMVFAMSVSVFAAASTSSNEFNATATVKVPAIDVTVPSTSAIFINPMGFAVTTASGEAAAVGQTTGVTNSQIVSPVSAIENKSPMNLEVYVSGALTPAETNQALIISGTPLATDGSDVKNTVFIYAHFDTATLVDGSTLTPPVADYYTLPAATYSATNSKTLALSLKAPTTPIKVGEIAKGTPNATDATKTDPGLFGFEFLGECNKNAKADWNKGDSVAVKLAFTFKPIANLSSGSNS